MTTNRYKKPNPNDDRNYIAVDIAHNWRDHRGRYHKDNAAIFTRPTQGDITVHLQGTGGMWQFTSEQAHKLIQDLERAIGDYTPPVPKPGPATNNPFGW